MKIKIERIKNLFKKLPKTLALHPFLSFWGLLSIALILGGFVFYRYSILAEKLEIETARELLKFKQETYQEVINQWQQREESLENINSKQYINPFQMTRGGISPPVLPEEATSTPEELPPEELLPEEPSLPSNIEELLTASNLTQFYMIKGERMPFLWQRAKMWQEKGLGLEDEYKGSKYQNMILLEKLKEELTE